MKGSVGSQSSLEIYFLDVFPGLINSSLQIIKFNKCKGKEVAQFFPVSIGFEPSFYGSI